MIKELAFCFLIVLAHQSVCQINEDFSDGNYTLDPSWSTSDDNLWQISSGEMQSNSLGAATYWISTPSTVALDAQWELIIKLKFSTSGANYVDIFLMSDTQDLANASNGYFVRVGGTQDEIVLYKLESGTATAIIDAAEGVVNSSNNNSFRVRIERNSTDTWSLLYDDGLVGSFITAGSVTDNAVNDSNYFGFLVEQSSAAGPRMNHFFDEITVNGNSFEDNMPPELVSSTVTLPNQITLLFDESLNASSVTSLINYSLNNGFGSPSIIEIVTPNQILLSFNADFYSANYQLTAENIEDQNSNIASPFLIDFEIFIPDEPNPRDIIITEIFADPSPSSGLPDGDFIELFNHSTKTFELKGWMLSDLAGIAVLPNYILAPGEYLILCSNAQVDNYSAFGTAIGLSSFPNFNNAGDQVALKDASGQLVDVVNYDDSWYKDDEKSSGGFSLELINPLNVCGGIENWEASSATIGGTPGIQNSLNNLSSGIEIPEIISVRAVNQNEILIEFTEQLDSLTIALSDFNIDQGITVSNYLLDKNIIRLFTSEPFENSIEYTLTIQNFMDCTGNTVKPVAEVFEFIVNPSISFKGVIISEIMANPNDETELPNAEYVELYNNTASNLNLEFWTFSDASNSVELPYYILAPADYVILTNASDANLFNHAVPIIGLSSLPTLNNSSDVLTIRTEKDELLDSVNYSSSWYRSSIKDDGGFSLEIIDPSDVCSDDLNWIATENPQGGTPGVQNSVFSSIPDNRGPELIAAVGISKDTILLEFNELLNETSIRSAQYNIGSELSIKEIVIADLETIYLILEENTPLLSGEIYMLSISNLTDCPGNLIEQNEASFSLIEQAQPDEILLNEILFNPRSGGVDFVEIFNKSDKFINLKGWQLANGELINDTLIVKTTKDIAEDNLIINPSSYLVFTSDPMVLKDQYPKSEESSFIMLPSLPSFPDAAGIAILLNEKDAVFEFFNYSEDFHASVISNEEGVSLERISMSEATNNRENWFSASKSENFATPGYLNSQSKKVTNSAVGNITIDPPIITPDGDGQNDFTTISYELDQAGYVATIKIMDVSGKTVKVIAENDFLSSRGFYSWDGSDNNNEILRLGYYIIYMEVFHSNGTKKQFKEKVVIGTRF